MKILMIAKQKGGVGASTLVRELAVKAASSGQQVVLVDLDPQGTTRTWWNRRTAQSHENVNPALAVPQPGALTDALAQLRAANVDLVLIDSPPTMHPALTEAMRAADLILLPTRPTVDDLSALPAVLSQVEATTTPWASVITQAPAGRSRLFDEALGQLSQRGPVAPTLRLRTDFPTAAAHGLAVTEAAPKGKAAEEVAELWAWVEHHLARTPVS